MPPTQARSRTRTVRVDGPVKAASNVTKAMQELAKECYMANSLANAARNKCEKARKALYQAMKEAKVEAFEHDFMQGKVRFSTVSTISKTVRYNVNINKLRQQVEDDDKVMSLCQITQGSVVNEWGTATLNLCLDRFEGEEGVSVKASK